MRSFRCSLQSLRRLYATSAPTLGQEPTAFGARTASTPLAVRMRRQKKFGPVEPGASDATPEGLTPTEHARFVRLRALNRLPDGIDTSEAWIKNINQRRSRIRGLKVMKKPDGQEDTEVLGRRVYLPNMVFRLVRNNTPPGQPYNPFEATFRIPNSVTKTDVRSYLATIYGVRTTYIRTDNYISQTYPRQGNKRKAVRTYKRAVVGLVDPFYYPHRVEDMEEKEREQRLQWIENNFAIQQTRNMQKSELLRMTKGMKLKAPFATKRSHMLRLVAERRKKREDLVASYTSKIQEMRGKGERIVIKDILKKPAGKPLAAEKPKGSR